MARLQAKIDTRFELRVSPDVQGIMQDRTLYGWWARNRALIVEVDENSIVQAIAYACSESRPQGLIQWLEGKE